MEESGTVGQGRGLVAQVAFLGSIAFAGLLTVLAYPPFNFAETAYVFAVPLFLCACAGLRIRYEAVFLWLSGLFAWMVNLSWLRHCTDHLSSWQAPLLGWMAVAALAAVVALFWATALWLANCLLRRASGAALPGRLGAIIAVAALWVIVEWGRGWLFGGFPWLTLDISQWQRPVFLQIASLTGGAGISFILMAFNVGLSWYFIGLWRKRRQVWWKRLSVEFYSVLALLFLAVGYGLSESGANRQGRLEGPMLAFVQPNAAPMEKWDPEVFAENLSVLEDLSQYGKLLGADLILWPEAATALPILGNVGMEEWAAQLSAELDRPLLVGNMVVEVGEEGTRQVFNTVNLVDPSRGVLPDYYAKRKLVPFGEYVPLANAFPFIRSIVPVPGDLQRGREVSLLKPSGAGRGYGRVGALICYEDIFSRLARDNVLAGADWHFVVTNNAWFGEEAAGFQHAAHSVMRAVETRRPVVRCGNAGWSGIIDEFGHIRHIVADEQGSIYFQGVEVAEFSRNHWWSGRQSLFVRWGNWFIGCAVVLLIAGTTLIVYDSPAAEEPAIRKTTRLGRRNLFEQN